jgi:hypothetical protein
VEFNEILKEYPNYKAVGVLRITYELIKNASKTYKEKLIELYNLCIKIKNNANQLEICTSLSDPETDRMGV